MTVISAHKTDTGSAHRRNEDCVWVGEQEVGYVVRELMTGGEP